MSAHESKSSAAVPNFGRGFSLSDVRTGSYDTMEYWNPPEKAFLFLVLLFKEIQTVDTGTYVKVSHFICKLHVAFIVPYEIWIKQ